MYVFMMYVCMYVCSMYVCIYDVCMYVFIMYVCMYVCNRFTIELYGFMHSLHVLSFWHVPLIMHHDGGQGLGG